MKINKLSVSALAMSVLLFACGNETATTETADKKIMEETTPEEKVMEAVKSTIDTETSSVHWTGEMLGLYAHSGTLTFNSGEVELEGGHLKSGNFEVDVTSITPTDENYKIEEGSTPEKLIGHLSSPDFFDVENYPTAKFEITEVEGDVATGMLTIKDVSKEATVESITVNGNTLAGTLTFNRKDFGVSFDHPVKEKVLSDDIALNIEIMIKEAM